MEYDYIKQGDCLQLMKDIPYGSVDMILTDPPYDIRYCSNRRVKTDRFDPLKNDDNDSRILAYPEFARILKSDSVAIVFTSWKNIAVDLPELQKYFDVKNIIVWFKGGGGIGDLKHTLSTDYELAIVCHEGKCKLRGKREGSVWTFTKVNSNKMLHPTQKPADLLVHMIEKYTDRNAVVFDPFMGSGSTCVAAANSGRHYIGFEIYEKYFEIARKRLSEV